MSLTFSDLCYGEETFFFAEKLGQSLFRHFSHGDAKLRISQDICCVRTTNIECTMTIFGQCFFLMNKLIDIEHFKCNSTCRLTIHNTTI